jgi:hypothetical protein
MVKLAVVRANLTQTVEASPILARKQSGQVSASIGLFRSARLMDHGVGSLSSSNRSS